MEVIILLLAGAALLFYMYRRSKGWRTLLSGQGPEAESIQAKYQFLKSSDVRCRLQTGGGAALGAVQTAAAAVDPYHNELVQLVVSEEDVPRAEELLQQFTDDEPMISVPH